MLSGHLGGGAKEPQIEAADAGGGAFWDVEAHVLDAQPSRRTAGQRPLLARVETYDHALRRAESRGEEGERVRELHQADALTIKCCSARGVGDEGYKVGSARNLCKFASNAECPYAGHVDQSHLYEFHGRLYQRAP